METFLYGYKLNFDDKYLEGVKVLHYISEEANLCAEKMLEIYCNITTLNELIDFGQTFKEKIYFDTVEKILKKLDSDFNISSINKVSFGIECSDYWGKFEIVFSDILDKYIGSGVDAGAGVGKEQSFLKKSPAFNAKSLLSMINSTKGTIHSQNEPFNINSILSVNEANSLLNNTTLSHFNKAINEKMKIVLHDPLSIQSLSKAVNTDIMNLVYLMSKYIVGDPSNALSNHYENFKKAKLIVEEIESNAIPKEKLKPFLAQLIYLSPFDPKNYVIPYYIFGDENNELENLAISLGVDIDFSTYKRAEENAKEYFGYDYSDIEAILSDNMFYKQTKDLLGNDLSQLVNECKYLFNSKLQRLFLSPFDIDKKDVIAEIISLYGCFDKNDEDVLLIFDNNESVFGRDGFILTNRNIYFYVGAIFDISIITSFSFSSLNFTINKNKVPMLWENLSEIDLSEIHDFLFFFLKVSSHFSKVNITGDNKLNIPLSKKAHNDIFEYTRNLLNIFNDDELKITVTALSNNPYIKKKFQNAISNYAILVDSEIPLLLYDNTAFGSAKEGCLITTKGIHIHNSFLKPKKFYYNEISSIEVNRSVPYKIFVNDYELQTTLLTSNESKVRFCSILNRIKLDFSIGHSAQPIKTQPEVKLRVSLSLIENINKILSNDIVGSEIQKFVHVYSATPKIQKKFSNAISSYAQLEEGELPIICFDNTLFGSAKEGCLITSTCIHIHNILSNPEKFFYKDISSISLKEPSKASLFINASELQTTNLSSHETKVIFCKLLNYILDNVKK